MPDVKELDINRFRGDVRKFLEDEDIRLLKSKLSQFDLFKVLNKTYDELTISQILAWLLNPKETHKIDDYFLKHFLIKTIETNQNNNSFNKEVFSIPIIERLNFMDIIIQTEEVFSNQKRADITLRDDPNGIYILIENKVRSSEGEDQTNSYYSEASVRYPSLEKLFIYLSPNGSDPESNHFLSISYRDLVVIIDNLIQNKEKNLEQGVLFLLNQTKKNFEENILESSEIDEICLRLYKAHSEVIERIYQARPKNKQYYETMAEEIIKQLGEDWTYKSENSYCAIYKYKWTQVTDPKNEMSIIHYEFNGLPNKLHVSIHVEDFRGMEIYNKIKDNLKLTKISEYKDADINKKQVIYRKTINNNINQEEIDNELNKGLKQMMKLIKETFYYIDEAVDRMITRAN